jgi:chaperonin GroES
MTLKPIQDRIVIKEVETEKKSPGGLILAGSAADKPTQGTVLSVGPGKTSEDGILVVPGVNPGDRVLFVQGAGQVVKLEDEEFRILQEVDILAIINTGETNGKKCKCN